MILEEYQIRSRVPPAGARYIVPGAAVTAWHWGRRFNLDQITLRGLESLCDDIRARPQPCRNPAESYSCEKGGDSVLTRLSLRCVRGAVAEQRATGKRFHALDRSGCEDGVPSG